VEFDTKQRTPTVEPSSSIVRRKQPQAAIHEEIQGGPKK